MDYKELKLETQLAQAGIRVDKQTGALVSPIHFSTTYQHPEFGQSTGFDYTRTKNPTRTNLERTLAAIEGADYAVATSSGMSALMLAMEIFPVGAKVLACRDLYGGSFRWFDKVEQQGRFRFVYANTEDDMLTLLDETVDVVFIETPTNPLMNEFDIATIAAKAKTVGAKTVVDNTFYTPIYQRPIELGADLVIHSATKYLGGHNDVLAGAVITNDQAIYDQLFFNLNTTGIVLSPFDSYMLMRGLKTLKLRMEKATANARDLVSHLKSSPHIKEVLYPGKGGMLSIKLQDERKIPSLLNKLQIFTFAESLGGVESLITYPTTQTHADIPAETRHAYGLTDDLLRLSIGIEDVTDLIWDLEQALAD
ncbi:MULTISPECIES: cystathionine gamma-synthase [unclassified Streptococcus]|uniref:cystathionine gamma-synthase n=1 Tax=unclassified Streptococcus TaxID=2608887 RepID=UPI00359E4BEE